MDPSTHPLEERRRQALSRRTNLAAERRIRTASSPLPPFRLPRKRSREARRIGCRAMRLDRLTRERMIARVIDRETQYALSTNE